MSDFTQGDLTSPLWLKLVQHLNGDLANLREYNDHEHNSDVETATIRGQIKYLKSLLALAPSE